MSGGRSFVDGLMSMDKRKATKTVINGIIIGVIFATILFTSESINSNATSWYNWQHDLNVRQYENMEIGYDDYLAKERELGDMVSFMQFQDTIFVNVGRVGAAIGFLVVAFGFLGFATNDQIDERTRRVALIIAGLMMLCFALPFIGGLSIDL
ncbi:MAG: hypothetical protein ACFFCS_19125 [Candidatus Hodarchaeota archaeon]